ncbi:MAG: hypothetical protein AAGI51_01440, partial [Pseudomonadota bacterium]
MSDASSDPAAPDAPRADSAWSEGPRVDAPPSAPPRDDTPLRAVAEACDWVMRFPCRTAPGLVFVGARSEPAAVWDDPTLKGLVGGHAGGGETPEAAFAACMGEAAEFLCQFERPGDLLAPGAGLPEAEGLAGWTPPDAAQVRAERLSDGAPCALPAARALRR